MLGRIGRSLLYCIMFPGVLIFRAINPGALLFYSRIDEFDGNAYALYNWAKDKRKCYFLLDKNAPKFEKGMIPYRGLRHIFLSLAVDTFVFDVLRDDMIYAENVRNFLGYKTKTVFLQHGVIMGEIPLYYYEKTRYNLVITSAQREYQFLKERFHYPESNLALTGLARYDDLLANKSDKRFVLIMPTWNTELRFDSDEDFMKTEFYKTFQSLLQNSEFSDFFKKNNLKLRLYLHYKLQDKQKLFLLPEDVSVYDSTDSVHELLRDCSLLITDYSSVAFDVALADKALIYYQFEKYRYESKDQYFDFEDDGFGPVVTQEKELVNTLINLWNGDSFTQTAEYARRRDSFFAFQDTNNCQRIYERITLCQKSQ